METMWANKDPNKYKPIHKLLPTNFHPQQNEFIFNSITITTKFDSGNLLYAENPSPDTV
jgi:hypothetical protein